MNHNVSLALAIGGGLVGLVLLHAFMHQQSAAASAITVGATLSSPFNVIPDNSGALINNAQVSTPDTTTAGGTVATTPGGYTGWNTMIFDPAPAGIPAAGWDAAQSVMHNLPGAANPVTTDFLQAGSQ